MRLRGPPQPPPRHTTLVHALAAAAAHPSGATFLDLHERETSLPWSEVRARAERAAANLVHLGIRRGDRVAIVLRTEPAFLDAFFGAWLAGAVPVPLYPPVRLGRLDAYAVDTGRMIQVAGARLVVSAGGTRRLLGGAVERGGPELGCVDVSALSALPARIAREPEPDALGLVQFSSGTTVDPKPVALTHRALAAMTDALVAATSAGPDDVLVSWLPLYHDMGLIGCLLAAMSYPGPLVLIPPEHFLTRPALWLRALARRRGTISAAPSFAYAYAADRVQDADLAGLSLAPVRLLLDGAEPVSAVALRRFAERFAPHGLDPRALVPVYGLSEAALAVTFARPGGPLGGLGVDAARLASEGVVAPGGREVMPVGTPVPGVEVELRTEAGAPVGEGRIGRVFVRGPALMREYLGDPEATARALRGGWLDTGDLGFVVDGALHLHGRARDLVIVRGANHAPEEFEAPLAALPGLRPGCAVALGFEPEGGAGEALLVLAERARDEETPDGELEARVRRAVLAATGIAPHTVRLLAPGTLPRTSSGKLRRAEALRRFQAGTLTPPQPVSAIRLALAAARSQLAFGRSRRRGG
ncbi:AMP-dependent synthetase and ligase [Anaeromyxobacter dehalogenans 2CP-1]|uniref:AMP-dependent synthetase and ligase n=1 Tax=Anaeromyxobacter dehalogenans (strain ATCC BAA-258 / DSM 21875 / 2CP-1) TaxID=455488 RepID=B8JAW4_ANAD2|nr:AMP-binding protein [Anaeromyxobacter dehalogenans]ACL63775.1 AMP-dependent synthetase and ligase [Anaeromyxobacter dehalogenans 2CP-1]